MNPIAIVLSFMMIVGVIGGVEQVRRKSVNLYSRRRVYNILGKQAVALGISQIAYCMLILLSILAVNLLNSGEVALVLFAGSIITLIVRLIISIVYIQQVEAAK
jgi:hypothetical protein